MKCLKFLIFLSLAGSALSGGESICEPLRSNYNAFFQVFEDTLMNIEQFALVSANSHPLLAPVFVELLRCVKPFFLDIAANATSRIAGVDSLAAYNAFSGVTPLSSLDTLSCIADDLVYMKDNFTSIDSNLIPRIQGQFVPSSINTTSCLDVYTILVSYIGTTVGLMVQIGSIVTADTATYGSINMVDLYLKAMAHQQKCMFNVLGVGLGTILDANIDAVNAYISGTSNSLPYPYDCVKSIIDLGKNIFSQAFSSFSDGKPLSLTVPAVPAFNPFG